MIDLYNRNTIYIYIVVTMMIDSQVISDIMTQDKIISHLETTKKSVVSGGINNHNNVFLSEVFI
jgi:hypothetical protein